MSGLADIGAPLIRMSRYAPDGVLFAQAEYLHVSGSTYDRIAGRILDEAPPGEWGAVAGTGSECLAFLMAASPRRRKITAVVPEGTLPEHRVLLEEGGAEVQLSPGAEGLAGADRWAARWAETHGRPYWHGPSTAPTTAARLAETLGAALRSLFAEVPEAERPRTLVAPHGDGALLQGLGAALGPSVHLIGTVHPDGPSLQDGTTTLAEAPPGAELVVVSDAVAFAARLALARLEGLIIGLGSAGAASVAQARARQGPTAFVALDAGDRYFSVDRRLGASP